MKLLHSALTIIGIVGAICLSAPRAHAQQLVVNGGFESGAFSPGWTITDPDPLGTLSNIGTDPQFAHSGTFHANLGTTSPSASLSQTLSTTPAAAYTLSFWLAHDVTTAPSNQFQIFFDNQLVFSLPANVGTFGYTNFTFTNLSASGSSTALEFRFADGDDFFRLDDVSVIPEPATTALLALAGLLLPLSRLRTKKSSVP